MAEFEIETVNLASLKLVKSELLSAIDAVAKLLEKYSIDRQRIFLDDFQAGLQQISGTLSLVQLSGADLLATELVNTSSAIENAGESTDAFIEVLAQGLFVLPRYIEYVLKKQRGMAVLLIPFINDLRTRARKPNIPESHYYSESFNWPVLDSVPLLMTEEEQASSIRRFRHMYQAGLLGILQGKTGKIAYGMMQRAVQRLTTLSAGVESLLTWQLSDFYLDALAKGTLKLTKSRKRLLGAIDRQIKAFLANSERNLKPEDQQLNRELLFLVMLGQPLNENAKKFVESIGCAGPTYSDVQLREEMDALSGPNAETVASVSAVLQDELQIAKEILELASQAQDANKVDLGELVSILKKVADILPVIGLTSASAPLRENIQKIQGWQNGIDDSVDLLPLADTLLYVESRIGELDKLNPNDERAGVDNFDQRHVATSKSHFAQAQQVVLAEIEAGIALIKRGLNSFAESNYDRGHIKNVSTTLIQIRGGMLVMEYSRAAKIAEQCANFIDSALMLKEQPAVLQQLLETFADAVISLEYYVNAIQSGYDVDEKVLEVAEESLTALGYPVG